MTSSEKMIGIIATIIIFFGLIIYSFYGTAQGANQPMSRDTINASITETTNKMAANSSSWNTEEVKRKDALKAQLQLEADNIMLDAKLVELQNNLTATYSPVKAVVKK